jgi:hypothetical protein
MMRFVNGIMTAGFDILLRPLRTEGPWPGMLAVSLLTALLAIAILKWTSNPAAIRRRRDRAIARVLEMALFRHDAVMTVSALGRALSANAAYVSRLFVPFLVSVVPMMLIMVQVYEWFGHRPLREGETVLVTARLAAGVDPLVAAELRTSANLRVDSAPVRVVERHEISWRIRAERTGPGWVNVAMGGAEAAKTLEVGRAIRRTPAVRTGPDWWRGALHPSEPPLSAGGPVVSVAVGFPALDFPVGRLRLGWLGAFVICTMLFALVLLKPMKVAI